MGHGLLKVCMTNCYPQITQITQIQKEKDSKHGQITRLSFHQPQLFVLFLNLRNLRIAIPSK